MPSALLLAALAATALAVSAGCGGGPSREDYARSLADATGDLASSNRAAAAALSSEAATGSSESALAAAGDAYRRAAQGLDAVEPPGQVEQLHEQLVRSAGTVAQRLADASTAAGSGNEQALRGAGARLESEAKALRELAERLREEGF